MSDRQNDRFARPSESLSSSPGATWHHTEALSKLILSKWMNFQTSHLKKLEMISIKLTCFFKLFQDQRIQAFYQLINWISVGPSKCPINKMIGSQGHLTVWRVPWVLCEQAKSSLLKFFSKWIIFQIRHFKKLIAVYIDYKKVKLTTINFHGRTNVNILCKHSLCDFVKIPQMFLAFPC